MLEPLANLNQLPCVYPTYFGYDTKL